MNFRSDYFILVILSIIQNILSQDDVETFEVCPNLPKNLNKVDATVYFNGCTETDSSLFRPLCSLKNGIPSDVLSITLKVGAEVTVENDKYSCINRNEAHDCKCTFQYACLSRLMDQTTFLNFICYIVTVHKTLEESIEEYGMDQQLTACMNGENSDINPKQIALDNAQEILNKGVDLDRSGEPFTLFTENFDYCVDHVSYYWLAKSVCSQFTQEVFNKLDDCKKAFSN